MIVIDASVAIKWINAEEKDSDSALTLFQRHIEGAEEILVPRLLFYEVANTLATKSRTTEKSINLGLAVLLKANLILYQEPNEDLIEAAILARRYQTSVYDMLYAVIAKNKKVQLITADEKIIKKTKFDFVKLLASGGKTN